LSKQKAVEEDWFVPAFERGGACLVILRLDNGVVGRGELEALVLDGDEKVRRDGAFDAVDFGTRVLHVNAEFCNRGLGLLGGSFPTGGGIRIIRSGRNAVLG
jgi:hypothetical protein